MAEQLTNYKIDSKISSSIKRISKYINARTKLKFQCLKCKHKWATLARFVCNRKTGCPKCAKRIKHSNLDIDRKLKTRTIKRIGNYINLKRKIRFQCLVCLHLWSAVPNNIINKKHGCAKCSRNLKLEKSLINQRLLSYNLVLLGKYRNSQTKVTLKCLICQYRWKSFLGNNLRKKCGCPKCKHHISNAETAWLDSLNSPKAFRNKSLKINNKRIMPDAFDPKTKTIYEFYGDFWHGNPMIYKKDDYNSATKCTFGELYQKTLDREKMIIDAGYNLIIMWESEYEK